MGLGVVHKVRHGLSGGGGQRFCDTSTKALVIKRVTVGGRGRRGEESDQKSELINANSYRSKIVQNDVMSFMDDPLCTQQSKPQKTVFSTLSELSRVRQKLKSKKLYFLLIPGVSGIWPLINKFVTRNLVFTFNFISHYRTQHCQFFEIVLLVCFQKIVS